MPKKKMCDTACYKVKRMAPFDKNHGITTRKIPSEMEVALRYTRFSVYS